VNSTSEAARETISAHYLRIRATNAAPDVLSIAAKVAGIMLTHARVVTATERRSMLSVLMCGQSGATITIPAMAVVGYSGGPQVSTQRFDHRSRR